MFLSLSFSLPVPFSKNKKNKIWKKEKEGRKKESHMNNGFCSILLTGYPKKSIFTVPIAVHPPYSPKINASKHQTYQSLKSFNGSPS